VTAAIEAKKKLLNEQGKKLLDSRDHLAEVIAYQTDCVLQKASAIAYMKTAMELGFIDPGCTVPGCTEDIRERVHRIEQHDPSLQNPSTDRPADVLTAAATESPADTDTEVPFHSLVEDEMKNMTEMPRGGVHDQAPPMGEFFPLPDASADQASEPTTLGASTLTFTSKQAGPDEGSDPTALAAGTLASMLLPPDGPSGGEAGRDVGQAASGFAPEEMSVKQLKRALTELDMDFSNCLEKSEFVDMLRNHPNGPQGATKSNELEVPAADAAGAPDDAVSALS
jgi:hypothetical protein